MNHPQTHRPLTILVEGQTTSAASIDSQHRVGERFHPSSAEVTWTAKKLAHAIEQLGQKQHLERSEL